MNSFAQPRAFLYRFSVLLQRLYQSCAEGFPETRLITSACKMQRAAVGHFDDVCMQLCRLRRRFVPALPRYSTCSALLVIVSRTMARMQLGTPNKLAQCAHCRRCRPRLLASRAQRSLRFIARSTPLSDKPQEGSLDQLGVCALGASARTSPALYCAMIALPYTILKLRKRLDMQRHQT